jgi:cell division protein FtsB
VSARTRPSGTNSTVRTPAARKAAATRRNRVRLALAGAVAVAILVTSFPLGVLFGQHRQLSAAAAQVTQLHRQNALLAEQRQQLNTNAEVKRLAQQNYQLVQPGRSLFVILPPAGQAATTPGAPTAGDPANQPLISPAQAPNMSPDPGLPQTPTTPGSSSGAASSPGATNATPGFWSRIAGSLEFWK